MAGGTGVTYAGFLLKALRWVLFGVVIYFFVLPLIPAFRNAIADLRQIDPVLLVAAIALSFMALYCYTLVTHAALGSDANRLTRFDLFRIQLSTRALGSILPAGSAASNALVSSSSPARGFRKLTQDSLWQLRESGRPSSSMFSCGSDLLCLFPYGVETRFTAPRRWLGQF